MLSADFRLSYIYWCRSTLFKYRLVLNKIHLYYNTSFFFDFMHKIMFTVT